VVYLEDEKPFSSSAIIVDVFPYGSFVARRAHLGIAGNSVHPVRDESYGGPTRTKEKQYLPGPIFFFLNRTTRINWLKIILPEAVGHPLKGTSREKTPHH